MKRKGSAEQEIILSEFTRSDMIALSQIKRALSQGIEIRVVSFNGELLVLERTDVGK